MIKKFDTYINESLKGKLKGKSKEEIKKLFGTQSDGSVLAKCAIYGFLDIIKEFFEENGIDHVKLDSLLVFASDHGHLDIVKYLIDKGAHIKYSVSGSSAVHASIQNRHYDVTKYLLSNTDFRVKDDKLLAFSVHMNRHEAVEILLDYFKYPLETLKKQIGMAKSQQDDQMVKILKDYRKINYPNNYAKLRKYLNLDESLNEDVEYKKVSNSLFWNFVKRMTDLDTKFELNTIHIKDVNNSLDTDDYILFLETSELNTDAVRYELKYSSALSNILNYLDDKVNNKVSFYVGFKMNSELHFGFIFDDKKYKIGYIYYQSSDFFKLRNLITKTNKEINLLDLSKRFKSKISTMVAINTLVTKYLSKYEDITIYNSVVDEGFCILIECKDNDILNKNYLDKIIESNVKLSRVEYTIEQEKRNNKTIYYIIIK